jgi:L-alanine-DL-glutamate epimerase-like enolase superfamily enzyme
MRDAGRWGREPRRRRLFGDEDLAVRRLRRGVGGHLITLTDLNGGLEPFRKIRAAVGDRIEVMCEMHSMWTSHAAIRICNALEEYRSSGRRIRSRR